MNTKDVILVAQYPSGLVKVVCNKIVKNCVVGEGSSVKEALGDLFLKQSDMSCEKVVYVSEEKSEQVVERCQGKYVK